MKNAFQCSSFSQCVISIQIKLQIQADYRIDGFVGNRNMVTFVVDKDFRRCSADWSILCTVRDMWSGLFCLYLRKSVKRALSSRIVAYTCCVARWTLHIGRVIANVDAFQAHGHSYIELFIFIGSNSSHVDCHIVTKSWKKHLFLSQQIKWRQHRR